VFDMTARNPCKIEILLKDLDKHSVESNLTPAFSYAYTYRLIVPKIENNFVKEVQRVCA